MYPRDVKDRLVQFPSRYRLLPVGGTTDTFDLVPITGVITETGTPINKEFLQPIEQTLLKLQLMNASIMGSSVTYDWNAQGLPNWEKSWSEGLGKGQVIKQVDYVWNSQGLPDEERYRFFGQEGDFKEFIVYYTWNSQGLPTMLNVVEVR